MYYTVASYRLAYQLSRVKNISCLSLLFCLLLLCFSPLSWAANSCTVSYKVTSQWNNGFTGDVTITNTGSAWSNWAVTWTMPSGQKVTQLWNGQLNQTGAAVNVTNVSWNAQVATNAKVQFGFNASHTGINAIPTDVAVNGVTCAGNAAPPPPPVTACEVKYTVSSQWNDGYTADVTLKNTGDPLAGWTVAWDMPNGQKITSFWNGKYQQTDARVSVTPLDWNSAIAKNANIQFGFNASHLGLNNIPGNITLNGVKCSGQVDPPPPPPPSCNVSYLVETQWNNGFTGKVIIKNTGVAWNGWQTTWTMPSGQKITQLWNGQVSQTDNKVTVTNVDFNKIVAFNAQIDFGFNASHTGTNFSPIDIAVNGTRCTGQADKLPTPPSAPSNLQGKLITNDYVDLTWVDNSADETNMVVERREDGGAWAVLNTLPANSISFQDKTLVDGKSYDYQVKATNAAGASSYSNSVTFKRKDALAGCINCHGSNGQGAERGVPVIAGLDRAYLSRMLLAYRNGTRASSVMGKVTQGYTEAQLDKTLDYFAPLSFVPAQQTTTQALVDKGKTIHESKCIGCHKGTGNLLAPTGTRLDGQWIIYLQNTLEDYYTGRTTTIPAGMATQLAGLKTTSGEDALQALAHYYAADATAKAGGSTGGGGSGGGDTNTAPTAPTNLTASVIDNAQVKLNWKDNSNNETAFQIQRRTSGGGDANWMQIAEVMANNQTYTDASMPLGVAYDYRVLAVNTIGTNPSNTATATLLTLLQYGQAQYSAQGCAGCHGADGTGGVTQKPLTKYTAAQLADLTSKIQTTMPPTNPAACVNNCAAGIAQYITDVLTPAANTNNPPQACTNTPPAGLRSLRLLTRQEYQNTVNDLLGLTVDLVQKLPEENRVGGFDNNVDNNQVTSTRLDAFFTQAEQLAGQAVQQSWSKIVPCAQQDTTCAKQFIQTFGKRAYRRPLLTTEVDSYVANFSQMTFQQAVEKTLMRMLSSPYFLYRSELGELQADGTYKLTPYEVASSLSYLFLGTMPDSTLFQAADQNALNTAAQRSAQAARLLSDVRSRQQVGHFVGQWLLKTNPYFLPSKDSSVYPAYTDAVRIALSQELINFFNYVTFDSTHTFQELYLADYIIGNNTLSSYYQLNSSNAGSTFSKLPVTDGTRTGILTLGAVLARYANSAESHPFKRGRFFFERILCHDLPEPANLGIVQPPDPDPNMTTRQRFDFHSKSGTSCYGCHQYMDGPGFGFENYDGSGRYRSQENGTPINAAGILRGMETYTPTEEVNFSNLNHLSQFVANSPTAAQCVARQYYRYSMGRIETAQDQCALDNYLKTYTDNHYNLQTMLLDIVNAPGFELRRAQ